MFGSGTTVKLEKALFERVKKCADAGGYSSAQEFVIHIVERELEQLEDGASDEEIMSKLQGLGYIE